MTSQQAPGRAYGRPGRVIAPHRRPGPGAALTAPAAGPELTRGPGPVLTSVRLHLVSWGTAWEADLSLQGQTESALRTILSSRYVTDLSEYDSGIGAGAFVGLHSYKADRSRRTIFRTELIRPCSNCWRT